VSSGDWPFASPTSDCSPSGLAAQTTVALTAATPISVMTDEAGSVTFDSVAANTPIGTWPDNVFLSTSQNPAGKFLHASARVYPGVPNAGGIALLYLLHAWCVAASRATVE